MFLSLIEKSSFPSLNLCPTKKKKTHVKNMR